MFFTLHPSSGVPLYRQLFDQLRHRIVSGQLVDGAQLPSVRELAAQLHLNPLTVSKVFSLLEQGGLVESRRGLGTFVAHRGPSLTLAARVKQLRPAVEQVAASAAHLRVPEDEVRRLLEEAFARLGHYQEQSA